MRYKISHPQVQEALDMVQNYKYALLYRFSDVYLCDACDVKKDDWQECYEARIFSEDAELHFIFEEDIRAILVEDIASNAASHAAAHVNEGEILISDYKLNGKYTRNLKDKKQILRVQQYLKEDEDGQMYIWLTRLKDLV